MGERGCTGRTKRNLKGGTGVGCASEDCEGENRVGEGRGKEGLRRTVKWTRERQGRKKKRKKLWSPNIIF